MTVAAIQVDQRVIGIDSRRFASVEKALVELITNSDDSYAGWIETIKDGRFTRIDVFRGENGGYLYDDGEEDLRAFPADYARLGMPDGAAESATRVTIVVDNPHVTITQHATLLQSLSDNIYLRDVLDRRTVELMPVRPADQHGTGHHGAGDHSSEPIRFEEPPAVLLLGQERPGSFSHEGQEYPFTLPLKRAKDVDLTLKGDERTNGLVVLSGMAACRSLRRPSGGTPGAPGPRMDLFVGYEFRNLNNNADPGRLQRRGA